MTCFWDRQKKARELQKPKAVCGRLGRKVSDGGGSRQRLLERGRGVETPYSRRTPEPRLDHRLLPARQWEACLGGRGRKSRSV